MKMHGGYSVPEGGERPPLPTTGSAVMPPPSGAEFSQHTRGFVDLDKPVITDLYARRTALRRELAGVEQAIERCRCSSSWAYVPPSAFEDRLGDRWVRVSYRTCTKCGLVNERIDENPRQGLGHWWRTAKFKKEEA